MAMERRRMPEVKEPRAGDWKTVASEEAVFNAEALTALKKLLFADTTTGLKTIAAMRTATLKCPKVLKRFFMVSIPVST